MDTTLRANVRQFAALWYSIALIGGSRGDNARETAMMQIQLYLSDFGVSDYGAEEYLKAADQAISQMYQPVPDSN